MTNELPILKQFRDKLKDARDGKLAAHKLEVKAGEFDRWRNNPAKCPPGSEVRQGADALWQDYERVRAQLACAPVAAPAPAPAPTGAPRRPARRGAAPTPGTNAGGAAAACLGAAFHNPYTFIPFEDPRWFEGPRARRRPTPLTIDELQLERVTGVLELELETLAPLLTCAPRAVDESAPHKQYRALCSGADVIVPASGVRGALRTLMTILAGGTLGYLDEHVWLVQARDLPLGPRGSKGEASVPEACFLARVERPGTYDRAGTVKLGETRLIEADKLERTARAIIGVLPRPKPGARDEKLWCDDAASSVTRKRDDKHCWQVKLSGRPVHTQGKREGLFLDNGRTLELSARPWAEYLGRHRHADHPELRTGDLVWLELAERASLATLSDQHVRSLQWARWGRKGERLEEVVRQHHPHLLPDALNADGLVDEVTDLFGQVPLEGRQGPAGPFAARVRPENLVFEGAGTDGLERDVPLAPLLQPHPGCAAFYRDCDDLDQVTNRGALRGYKVYRTTRERGASAPWHLATPGTYDEHGTLESARHKVNKTCDLLREGRVGRLRIACRALSRRELALLLLTCSVDWRLGGGKPLGLGHCRVRQARFVDESGAVLVMLERPGAERAALPQPYADAVADLEPRVRWWEASQKPVARLRYPRAASQNQNRKQRGGHVWFQRHATPRKSEQDGGTSVGLQVLWVDGALRDQAGGNDRVRAQALPPLAPEPEQDQLYGYDLYAPSEAIIKQGKNVITRLEPFDEQAHARASDRSGGPQGQNSETRRHERERR